MHDYESSNITELAKALINVQRQLQPASKDATNPFTKSTYATLNSVMHVCRDALLNNGIWMCQYPVPMETGHLGLVTKLTHAESGQWQSSLAVVPLPKADPQGVGICMTYLRRYALSATLYAAHEAQVYGQLGLLRAVWNQPAFSLRDAGGTLTHHHLTFPQLCNERFGIDLPANPTEVLLEASVLALSMTEAKTFGPYLPDKLMLELCLQKATALWKYMETYKTGAMSINELDYAKGFYPLCEWCDWNFDCPKFNECAHQPEWETDLQKVARLKTSRTALDAEIDELETGLKDAYALSDAKGDWIAADSWRFKVSQQSGRRTINRERLRLELTDALGDEHAAEKLISWCEDVGAAFERLSVNRIKKPKTCAQHLDKSTS